jgi:hypothetical protein
MSKYLFGVVAAFALLVSFAQDAEAGWLFRGGRCGGSSYSGPTYYAPPTYYYYPSTTYYYPSCNSGYVIVSPPVVVDQKGAAQKQAPSFQDLPQKKVDQPNPPKVKESTTNPPPVIRAPAPSFQDLPPKK